METVRSTKTSKRQNPFTLAVAAIYIVALCILAMAGAKHISNSPLRYNAKEINKYNKQGFIMNVRGELFYNEKGHLAIIN